MSFLNLSGGLLPMLSDSRPWHEAAGLARRARPWREAAEADGSPVA